MGAPNVMAVPDIHPHAVIPAMPVPAGMMTIAVMVTPVVTVPVLHILNG